MHKVSENLSKYIKYKRTYLFASPGMLTHLSFQNTHLMRQENEKYNWHIKMKSTSIETNLLGSNNLENATITNDTTAIQASIAKIGIQLATKNKRT